MNRLAFPRERLGLTLVQAMLAAGCCVAASGASSATAAAPAAKGLAGFVGNWEIDLRTPAERQAKAECGHAYFQLEQHGGEILGEHGYATTGCGHSQIGGAVRGRAQGREALLEVSSPKQGALVRGKATLVKGQLKWETLEVIKPPEVSGELLLILPQGMLKRVPAQNFD